MPKDAKVTTLKEIVAGVMVKDAKDNPQGQPTMGHSIRGSHGKRNQMGGKCQVPCQREPFWIPFAAVMELGYIPNILRDKNFLDEFSRIRQQVVRFPAITNKK